MELAPIDADGCVESFLLFEALAQAKATTNSVQRIFKVSARATDLHQSKQKLDMPEGEQDTHSWLDR